MLTFGGAVILLRLHWRTAGGTLKQIAAVYRFLAAKAKKIRRWTTGDTEYTETSIFQIYRDMDVDFSRIPADASLAMPDGEMDFFAKFLFDQLLCLLFAYLKGKNQMRQIFSADSLLKNSISAAMLTFGGAVILL